VKCASVSMTGNGGCLKRSGLGFDRFEEVRCANVRRVRFNDTLIGNIQMNKSNLVNRGTVFYKG
jgi:hypothetical protein